MQWKPKGKEEGIQRPIGGSWRPANNQNSQLAYNTPKGTVSSQNNNDQMNKIEGLIYVENWLTAEVKTRFFSWKN